MPYVVDWIAQHLVAAPLIIQVACVLVIAVPVCAAVAWGLVRVIDWFATGASRVMRGAAGSREAGFDD